MRSFDTGTKILHELPNGCKRYISWFMTTLEGGLSNISIRDDLAKWQAKTMGCEIYRYPLNCLVIATWLG